MGKISFTPSEVLGHGTAGTFVFRYFYFSVTLNATGLNQKTILVKMHVLDHLMQTSLLFYICTKNFLVDFV